MSGEIPVRAASIEAAAAWLTAEFGLRACWFEPFPFDTQLPRIEPGRIVLAATEPGLAPWSGEMGIELPVRFAGLTVGRFVLVPASPTTGVAYAPQIRAEAMSIAASVGETIATAILAAEPQSTDVGVQNDV